MFLRQFWNILINDWKGTMKAIFSFQSTMLFVLICNKLEKPHSQRYIDTSESMTRIALSTTLRRNRTSRATILWLISHRTNLLLPNQISALKIQFWHSSGIFSIDNLNGFFKQILIFFYFKSQQEEHYARNKGHILLHST